MKRLGSEMASFLTVLAVSAGVASVFPYGALAFRATACSRVVEPAAAFVRLTPDEEARAMRAAKTSWQGDGSSVRNARADIFFSELPEETLPTVLSAKERVRTFEMPVVGCGMSPFLPSRRAAPLQRIAPTDRQEDSLPFSREELLKID